MNLADEGKVQPAGTQFLALVDSLIDLFQKPGISHVEVVFVHYKLDAKGEKVLENNKHVASIDALAITGISLEIREEIRKKSEDPSLISQMVLYRDAAKPGGPGVLKFRPVGPGQPSTAQYEAWEIEALLSYAQRNNP
jgi:hypothetical protein